MMTAAQRQASLEAKKNALNIAARILIHTDVNAEHIAAKAVDTAIAAAAMVVATAIAGSPEADQKRAVDAAVDHFVHAVKIFSVRMDGPTGLLSGMAASLALEKLNNKAKAS